jgi:acetyl-CoA/propionyl-CoA carboxylase carboxyl transferase subunit
MLAATGLINGCRVVAFCSDPARDGRRHGDGWLRRGCAAYERAIHDRVPILGIWHSGARLAEGVLSLHGVGRIFHAMTRPQAKIHRSPSCWALRLWRGVRTCR